MAIELADSRGRRRWILGLVGAVAAAAFLAVLIRAMRPPAAPPDVPPAAARGPVAATPRPPELKADHGPGPDEAGLSRIEAARKLLGPGFDATGEAEVVPGRKYAFVAMDPDPALDRVAVVEDGVVSRHAGRDRWLWEAGRPEDYAHQWAGRARRPLGAYRLESVNKGPATLTAVLRDGATDERFRLIMSGFDDAGRAVLSMDPIGR